MSMHSSKDFLFWPAGPQESIRTNTVSGPSSLRLRLLWKSGVRGVLQHPGVPTDLGAVSEKVELLGTDVKMLLTTASAQSLQHLSAQGSYVFKP